MPERNNGFADNKWGTFCRGIRDFLNAFDISAMALVGALIITTCIMAAIELFTPDGYVTPEWWTGPSGILFLVIVTLLGKHTAGYWIASTKNSPPGESPTLPANAPDPGTPPKPGG